MIISKTVCGVQELDDRSQLDRTDVRDKIREALENGVRRMNLVERQRETERHKEADKATAGKQGLLH